MSNDLQKGAQMKDAIRYKVTVTATVQRVESCGNEWKPITQERVEGSDKLRDVYGYTPMIDKVVQREITVYEQNVDNLDLAKVVLVVNGMMPVNPPQRS